MTQRKVLYLDPEKFLPKESSIEDELVGINTVPSGGTTGQVLKKVSDNPYDYSWQPEFVGSKNGWANYLDTEYTPLNPFTVADGITADLPNNAAQNITDYLPPGVASFYDPITQKFTPGAIGDYNIITVRFNAEAVSTSTYLEFGIDIGGTFGVVFRDIKVFPKGAGVEHPFSFVCPGFSLDTFVANGGKVKVTAVGGDVDIYNINYHFARVSSP